MSATRYLNELETERIEIERMPYATNQEKREFWTRLGDWWRKRDLGFGDGQGMKSHCFAMAEKFQPQECEFCGDPATTSEMFDREIPLCKQCAVS